MSRTYRFFVDGNPAPQGSKSFKGMRGGKPVLAESSKALAPWRIRIAWHAQAARQGMLRPPVHAQLRFVMARPKSLPKSRPTPPAIARPDIDKLTRAVLDAITGPLISDDSHITSLHVTKRIAELDEEPGVHIILTEGTVA